MSVAIRPGRTSWTRTPCSASRAAKSWATMLSPAFATQYSPRLTLTVSLEIEVMKTI